MADWDLSVDILVVGAGGAGLAAAIKAHDLGAVVAIAEKGSSQKTENKAR